METKPVSEWSTLEKEEQAKASSSNKTRVLTSVARLKFETSRPCSFNRYSFCGVHDVSSRDEIVFLIRDDEARGTWGC